MTEELRYKASVDVSDIQMAQQQISNMAQQQASMMASSVMNPFVAMQGYGYGMQQYPTQLDPRIAFSNTAYQRAIDAIQESPKPFTPSVTNFYGGAVMSPNEGYNIPMSNNYSMGYIPGTPDIPDMSSYGVHHSMSTLGKNVAMGYLANPMANMLTAGMNAFHGITGFGSHIAQGAMGGGGLYGAPIDMPMFRYLQRASEMPAEQITEGLMRGASGLGNIASTAASLGSMFLPFSPMGMAGRVGLWGAAAGLKFGADTIFDGPREYQELGRYARDATATSIRSTRLGGGMDTAQIQQFQRGFGAEVANDKRLTRDDYAKLLQLSSDLGILQTTNSPDKVINTLDNMGKNVQNLLKIGVKLTEVSKTLEQFQSIGINVASDPQRFAQASMDLGLTAFQSGKTFGSALNASMQAGDLYRQQGYAPTVGVFQHNQSQALVGEAIRNGAMSPNILSLFGGRENVEAGITQTLAAMNRTGLGQALSLFTMMNPNMSGSKVPFNTMMGGMGVFSDPRKFLTMNFAQPELTDLISQKDPNAFGLNQLNNYVDYFTQALGQKKLDPGTLNLMFERMTGDPQKARSMTYMVLNAKDTAKGLRESGANYAEQRELEALRPTFDPTTSRGREKIYEHFFEKPISNMGAAITGVTGDIAKSIESNLIYYTTGKTYTEGVNNAKNVQNMETIMNESKGIRSEMNQDIKADLEEYSRKQVESNSNNPFFNQARNEFDRTFNQLREIIKSTGKAPVYKEGDISEDELRDLDDKLNNGTTEDLNSSSVKQQISKIANTDTTSMSSTVKKNLIEKIKNKVKSGKVSNTQIVNTASETQASQEDLIAGFTTDGRSKGFREAYAMIKKGDRAKISSQIITDLDSNDPINAVRKRLIQQNPRLEKMFNEHPELVGQISNQLNQSYQTEANQKKYRSRWDAINKKISNANLGSYEENLNKYGNDSFIDNAHGYATVIGTRIRDLFGVSNERDEGIAENQIYRSAYNKLASEAGVAKLGGANDIDLNKTKIMNIVARKKINGNLSKEDQSSLEDLTSDDENNEFYKKINQPSMYPSYWKNIAKYGDQIETTQRNLIIQQSMGGAQSKRDLIKKYGLHSFGDQTDKIMDLITKYSKGNGFSGAQKTDFFNALHNAQGYEDIGQLGLDILGGKMSSADMETRLNKIKGLSDDDRKSILTGRDPINSIINTIAKPQFGPQQTSGDITGGGIDIHYKQAIKDTVDLNEKTAHTLDQLANKIDRGLYDEVIEPVKQFNSVKRTFSTVGEGLRAVSDIMGELANTVEKESKDLKKDINKTQPKGSVVNSTDGNFKKPGVQNNSYTP